MKQLPILLVLLLVGMLLWGTIPSASAQSSAPQTALPDAVVNGTSLGKTDALRVYPEDLREFGIAVALIIDEPPATFNGSELPVKDAISAIGSVFALSPSIPSACLGMQFSDIRLEQLRRMVPQVGLHLAVALVVNYR